MRSLKKAFTLIELLIVIALLGALAVGLLAALDPFEQLKKGTDSGIRNTVSEFQGAIIRYYAIKNYMPWCSDASTCSEPATPVTLTTLDGASYNTAITQIINSGELKLDFKTLAGAQMGKVYVTASGSTTSPKVSVCFLPTSKSLQRDPNTKFNQDGSLASAGTCKQAGGSTDCYWCVQ